MKLNTKNEKEKVKFDTCDEHQLVNMKYITSLTGMTDKWFYSLMKCNEFPQPIKLGRSSRWKLIEIKKWIDDKYKE